MITLDPVKLTALNLKELVTLKEILVSHVSLVEKLMQDKEEIYGTIFIYQMAGGTLSENKLEIIKTLRVLFDGMGLKEAKDYMDAIYRGEKISVVVNSWDKRVFRRDLNNLLNQRGIDWCQGN